jgi:hypothetical protein
VLRSITAGVDASGRPLDPLMPRYELSKRDGSRLVAYLRSRGRSTAPGVTATTIDLATVITADADPVQAAATLAVLERFVIDKNAGTRGEARRRDSSGEAARDYRGHREWRLAVWRLEGPRASWPEQLAASNAQRPVFALLSGVVGGDGSPIYAFCEAERLPWILPNDDLPPNGADGGWTAYYSAGLALEAGVVATALDRCGSTRVTQVFRPGTRGELASTALREAARSRGIAIEDRPLGEPPLDLAAADAVVLWLAPAELARLGAIDSPASIFVSSTLHGGIVPEQSPVASRGPVTLVHPYALEPVRTARLRRFSAWAERRGVAVTDARLQEQTLFACMLFGEAMSHIKDNFDREYLLERIDHGGNMAALSAHYPRLSFGPGQRYLSKGAYLVPLAPAGHPEWIVP